MTFDYPDASGDVFQTLCNFLKKESGLIIDAQKRYLVESKMQPIIRREKLSGLQELVDILLKNKTAPLVKEVVETMTINETYFFRDKVPFDKFSQVVLPKLLEARPVYKTIRIWSAACSSGQEPYSLAMILDQMKPQLGGRRVEIIATDLSEAILAKAREGLYSQFEVQRGLPTPFLLRYFDQKGDKWQIKESLRSQVTFRRLNLLNDYSPIGNVDVIFCRNVLIYFDAAGKREVLAKMRRHLAPDGFLMLGASESLLGASTDFVADPVHRMLLVPAGGTPVASSAPAPRVPLQPSNPGALRATILAG